MHKTIDVQSYHPAADGIRLDTEAIQAAIFAVKDQGGHVVLPPGNYLSGPLELVSNLTFEIQSGAHLSFTTDLNHFPTVFSRWEGVAQPIFMPCIYGANLTNVTITGGGTIDGQGADWWARHQQREHFPSELPFPRPYLIGIDYSEHVTIQDVTLLHSPSWTVHPMECHNVRVSGVRIINPADSPNTDGINPESCQNVRISDCFIDVGDDCIAIKSGTEGTTSEKSACENIIITNCSMLHGHGGVVLGSEMSGNIRNVVISNCIFQDTDRGIRLKTRRGRGGLIENITVNNLIMENVFCPFVINAYYYCGPNGKEKYVWDKASYPIDSRTPQIKNISFQSILAKRVQAAAGFIYGLPEMPVEDIRFTDVHIEMEKDGQKGLPAMMHGLEECQGAGFFLGNTNGTTFNQVTITNVLGPLLREENTIDTHAPKEFYSEKYPS